MTKQKPSNIFIGTWSKLNEDVIIEENRNKDQKSEKTTSKSNLAVSLVAAFLIVIIAGQTLGFVRKTVIDPHIYDKYQNSRVIVYSNRC